LQKGVGRVHVALAKKGMGAHGFGRKVWVGCTWLSPKRAWVHMAFAERCGWGARGPQTKKGTGTGKRRVQNAGYRVQAHAGPAGALPGAPAKAQGTDAKRPWHSGTLEPPRCLTDS